MKLFSIFSIYLLLSIPIVSSIKCTERKGCECNCDWIKNLQLSKLKDDGSCCFLCCYKEYDKSSTDFSVSKSYFCPLKTDLIQTYGNPVLLDQGWINKGPGGVATKSSFNLLGGFVEYDIDVSKVEQGVNANIYTISPLFPSSGFEQRYYCDGQKKDSAWCTEIDWIESNGNCLGASTLHMIQGGGIGCTAWGCSTHYKYNGKTFFHMKIIYSQDGTITIFRDNKKIDQIKPSPTNIEIKNFIEQYSKRGAVIYSSLWKGWVPLEKSCLNNGNLDISEFTISNLKIYGNLIQGPKTTLCEK